MIDAVRDGSRDVVIDCALSPAEGVSYSAGGYGGGAWAAPSGSILTNDVGCASLRASGAPIRMCHAPLWSLPCTHLDQLLTARTEAHFDVSAESEWSSRAGEK